MTFQSPAVFPCARFGAKDIAGLSRHERPKRLERSVRDAQPLLLALQPETYGAGCGGLAERAHVADQRQGVDPHHQIQGVEEFLRAPGQVVTVEQIGDRPLDRRYPDLLPQAVDCHDAIRGCEAARRPDEPAGETGRLEHAGLSLRDDLHVMPLRVGVAVQLEGRVIGDRAAKAQTGGSQEAVDRPCRGVGMLGHRGEDATGDAPDVAGLEMLGEHRCDDLVLRPAANGRGIFLPPEDRVGAEEGRGDESRHGGSERSSHYSKIAIYGL